LDKIQPRYISVPAGFFVNWFRRSRHIQKVNELQNQINQTDKEIDRMVYDLYQLTSEEIEIVENSVK
jgi:TolA-binding protein